MPFMNKANKSSSGIVLNKNYSDIKNSVKCKSIINNID